MTPCSECKRYGRCKTTHDNTGGTGHDVVLIDRADFADLADLAAHRQAAWEG
jgi:hypothetical protein